ncbi:MAG: pitrilysin family protein [candidate division Zixibacteria bacterium]|nr:pitrilysin family protein [candidate division Zixibacteria bacterium]
MKKLLVSIIILTLAASVAAAPVSKGSQMTAKLKGPDINWSVPEVGKEVQRETLDNGIIVYTMPDHRLPIIAVTVMIHCGGAYVPLDRMAVPDLAVNVMRSGGSTTMPVDSLNTILESIGGMLEIRPGDDNARATLDVMSRDMDLGFRLLADVLRNPAFPEDKLELAKEERRTDIRRRNDNPGGITGREFNHLLYGDHPSGRILEWSHIKPVTRADLVAYYDAFFAPNNLMFGITGDFDPVEIKALLNKYFGDWQKKDIVLPEVPKVDNTPKPGVYEVIKDINQANIRFGHLGIDRDNPDRYAVEIMNYILGGGSFTSRITSKVRSDEGLAYHAGSSFRADGRDLGTFNADCQTKLSTAHKAIRLMVDEVNRIRTEMVGDEELNAAKDSYINRYIFNFATAPQIVGQLMSLEFDNRPPDLLQKYLDNVRKITKEDILRVAQTYLKPENLSFVIVGNPTGFEKPLDEFGKVTTIELTEPVTD